MTDLDARVAALIPCPFCGHETPEFERMGTSSHSCIVRCGNCGCSHESGDEYLQSGRSWNKRAELQKPALHEPVTDAEVASAIAVSCEPDLTTYGQGMRKALESVLQGRAKPAQEKITDEPFVHVTHDAGYPELWLSKFDSNGTARPIAGPERLPVSFLAAIRASKGEKT